jgi:predicted ArsR family transcriptional regulator
MAANCSRTTVARSLDHEVLTPHFNAEQWKQALGCPTQAFEGVTVAELAKELGIPRSTARGRLDKGIEAGTCEEGVAVRAKGSGWRLVRAYRLLDCP